MKKQKVLSCLLAGVMALSMTACGNDAATSNTETGATTPETAVAPVVEEDASIDFEDGNMGFVAPYMVPANAAEIEMAVVDYNGSKALQVKNLTGKVPFVGIDATSLLGADVAKVASVEMSIGVTYDNGKFSATSGQILAWSGEDLIESADDWSVYLESANPKKAVATLDAGEEFVADAGNIFIVNLNTDNGVSEGNGNATLYIDNIRFLDASGNLLKADSSVAFAAPKGFENTGKDYSNLCALSGAVNFEGFACTGEGWVQNGFDMPQEIIGALVPGSVVEIAYTSESGKMWVVVPDSAAGWMRVGDGNNGTAACVDGKAYITYEQIAEFCGDDVSTWGARLQCESDSAWEVYSVRVGTASEMKMTNHLVNFEGFACTGEGWVQNGFEMPQEVIDALTPGAVVAIKYTSESGKMWVVMPDSAAGWMRVGDGNNGTAACDGNVCQVTYEQIAEFCGDDVSTWGAKLQCESDSAWEVYSVAVGQTPVEE